MRALKPKPCHPMRSSQWYIQLPGSTSRPNLLVPLEIWDYLGPDGDVSLKLTLGRIRSPLDDPPVGMGGERRGNPPLPRWRLNPFRSTETPPILDPAAGPALAGSAVRGVGFRVGGTASGHSLRSIIAPTGEIKSAVRAFPTDRPHRPAVSSIAPRQGMSAVDRRAVGRTRDARR
jgi:hypothetical protein